MQLRAIPAPNITRMGFTSSSPIIMTGSALQFSGPSLIHLLTSLWYKPADEIFSILLMQE